MKTKNKTRYLQSILGAILAVSAALVLSCEQPDGSSVGAPAGKGSVAISVSTGGPAGSVLKTIVPDTDSPQWSRYDLVFKSEGKPDVEVSELTALDDFEQALDVGTWTVDVTVYQNFTPTPTGEEDAVAYDYQAATGTSESFTVTAGELETVDVSVSPIPQTTKGLTGIFSYAVEYTGEDETVTGELTLGQETLTLALDGKTVSKAVSPGNYKLTVKLTKGDLAVTRSAEVHIYAGFESKAEYTFTDANFTKYVYLVGDKPNLPANVSLTAIGVYTDAGYSSDNIIEGTGYDSTETEWFVWIPVAEIEKTLYLKSVMTTGSGANTTTYTATGQVENLTEGGTDGVKLYVVTSGSVAASGLADVIEALAQDGPVELDDLTITGTGAVDLKNADVTVTGSLTVPAGVTVAVGGSLDLTAADAAVTGTVSIADGGTLKAPALGQDGLPGEDAKVSFTGEGKVELAKGATGYYGEILFIGDNGLYNWGDDEATVTLKAGNVTEVSGGEVIAVANTGIAAEASIVVADGAKLSIDEGVTYAVGGTLDVKGDVDLSKGNVVVPGTVAVADGGALKVATPASQQAAEAFFGPSGTGSLVLANGSVVSRQNGEVEELYVGDTDDYIYKWGDGETGELVLAKNSQTLESGTLIVTQNESIQTGYTATVAEEAVLQIAEGAAFTMRGALNVTGGLDVLDGGELIVEDGASGILEGTIEVASGGVLKDQKSGGGSFWTDESTGSYIINAGAQAYAGDDEDPTIGKESDDGVLLALTNGTLTMHKDGYELTGEGTLKKQGFFVTDLLITAGSVLTIDEGGILGAVYGENSPGVTGQPAADEKEAAKIVVTKPNGYIDIYQLANPPVYTSNISEIPHNFYTAGGTKIAKNDLTGTTYAWAANAGGEEVAGWKASGAGLGDIELTDKVEDATITITGLTEGDTLYWIDNDTVTVSVTEPFSTYSWVVDGKERGTESTLTLKARDFARKTHTLTVFVTDENGAYSKDVTFTVAKKATQE